MGRNKSKRSLSKQPKRNKRATARKSTVEKTRDSANLEETETVVLEISDTDEERPGSSTEPEKVDGISGVTEPNNVSGVQVEAVKEDNRLEERLPNNIDTKHIKCKSEDIVIEESEIPDNLITSVKQEIKSESTDMSCSPPDHSQHEDVEDIVSNVTEIKRSPPDNWCDADNSIRKTDFIECEEKNDVCKTEHINENEDTTGEEHLPEYYTNEDPGSSGDPLKDVDSENRYSPDVHDTVSTGQVLEKITQKCNPRSVSSQGKELHKVPASKTLNVSHDVYHPHNWYYNYRQFLAGQEAPQNTDKDNLILTQKQTELHESPLRSPSSTCSLDTERTYSSRLTTPPLPTPSARGKANKHSKSKTKEALKKAGRKLEGKDRSDIAGKNIGNKLRELPKEAALMAEKFITDILFEAAMGNISRKTRMSLSGTQNQ